MRTRLVTVRGLVQGVGFRPFVYRTAQRIGVKGWVRNSSDRVEIAAQGAPEQLDEFIACVRGDPPAMARIDSIDLQTVAPGDFRGFAIAPSSSGAAEVSELSPDIAVCEHCLLDLATQEHRIDYPFINCTLCGPRFSITKSLPYDRPSTTMASFTMCPQCSGEYHDIDDRRFHAQPVACLHCGPSYTLLEPATPPALRRDAIEGAARLLDTGHVVATKGIGGYHLVCDPFDATAVGQIRALKRRDTKPFALMAADIDTARQFAYLSPVEERLLTSMVRPIVLLKPRQRLPHPVSGGLSTVGIMLPYAPVHHLLFARLSSRLLVMTSANISDEPITIDNQQARESFLAPGAAVLEHNRDIHQRVDDSVMAVVGEESVVTRRGRGLAPSPIDLTLDVDGIFAAGAELKSCFAIGKGKRTIVSQHLGDLKDRATNQFYRETLERYSALFRFTPRLVACDKHPDYLSTRIARSQGVPVVAVQHHHAHIASVMAEHRLDHPVIGVVFDGTGYGDDSTLWGGEFLVATLGGYTRRYHFRSVPLAGGDRAAAEPWRITLAHLLDLDRASAERRCAGMFPQIDPDQRALVRSAIKAGVNAPLSSAVGRLFDAVGALLGLGPFASFEAEIAMELEALCDENVAAPEGPYPWSFDNSDIDTRPLFAALWADRERGAPRGSIARRFHDTIIDIVLETCRRIRAGSGIDTVALSGGCFQNRRLLEGCIGELSKRDFRVLYNRLVPCNDGGIALGQLAIAGYGNSAT